MQNTEQLPTANKRGPKPKAAEVVRKPSGLLINDLDRAKLQSLQSALSIQSRNDCLAHCIKAADLIQWAETVGAACWQSPEGWVANLPAHAVQTAPAPSLLAALAHARALHG